MEKKKTKKVRVSSVMPTGITFGLPIVVLTAVVLTVAALLRYMR